MAIPTMGELYAHHEFNLTELASRSGVPRSTVEVMMHGRAKISRGDAQRVLDVINDLYRRNYTLQNVQVALFEREG